MKKDIRVDTDERSHINISIMEEDKMDNDDVWDYYSSMDGHDFPERDTASYINTYAPPFLLVMATFGNLLSAIILRKMYDRVLSTCLYLFVVVIIDLAALYILCGNVWFESMAGLNVKKIAMLSSNSVCKIYPFIEDFVLHLTIWLAVAMAIETTLVTMRPPRLLRMCNLERARAVILLIIVLLVCVNAHCFWTFTLVKVDKPTATIPEKEMCIASKQGNQNSEEFRKIVWPIMNILVADLLPYCIIFSCTVILITKRCKRRDQIRELETVWKSFSLDADSAKEFHLSFLVVCICHLVLLIPKMGYNIFYFLIGQDGLALVDFSFVLEARMMLADSICSLLLYIFLSCKFFMLLASSKRFRDEFVALMTCRGCCSRPSQNNRLPVVKSSVSHHQPLLHQVNNIDHHTHIQPAVSLGQQQPPPHNCNNISPRKQIYSMTSV